jgi:hypothetical protein
MNLFTPDTKFEVVCSQLMEIVNEGEPEDAFRALEALGALKECAAPAVPALIRSLRSERHRWLKCFTLGNIGPAAIRSEASLIRLIRSFPRPSDGYDYALQALGRIHSVKALPIFVDALNHASKHESDPGFDSLVFEVFTHLHNHGLLTNTKREAVLKINRSGRKNAKLITAISTMLETPPPDIIKREWVTRRNEARKP